MTTEIVCFLTRNTTDDTGTFGNFASEELYFHALSLELPARENTPMLSRIPAGRYLAEWSFTYRFKRYAYRLLNVPGRVGILIHPANFAGDKKAGWHSELSGGVALGRDMIMMENVWSTQQPALSDSRAMVQRFEKLAAKRPLIIYITDEPPLNAPRDVCDEP